MELDQRLRTLVGYWSVNVVDLNERLRWNDVPGSVQGIIRRGEIIRLARTGRPNVLYGVGFPVRRLPRVSRAEPCMFAVKLLQT